MVALGYLAVSPNILVRFCFIIVLTMPAFAASPGSAPAQRVESVVGADEASGRLVRRTIVETVRSTIVIEPRRVEARVVNPQPAGAVSITETTYPAVSDLKALVDRIASEQGVEESLVHSVIRAESNYNTWAISSKGAEGVMQLIPSTARRFGVTNVFDPTDNIQGGVKYLKFLLDYYQGDYPKAIAAYNAGEGAVDKYHGIPPYAETINYVRTVARNLRAARQSHAATTVPIPTRGPALPPPSATETHKPIRTSVGEDGRIWYRTP